MCCMGGLWQDALNQPFDGESRRNRVLEVQVESSHSGQWVRCENPYSVLPIGLDQCYFFQPFKVIRPPLPQPEENLNFSLRNKIFSDRVELWKTTNHHNMQVLHPKNQFCLTVCNITPTELRVHTPDAMGERRGNMACWGKHTSGAWHPAFDFFLNSLFVEIGFPPSLKFWC